MKKYRFRAYLDNGAMISYSDVVDFELDKDSSWQKLWLEDGSVVVVNVLCAQQYILTPVHDSDTMDTATSNG